MKNKKVIAVVGLPGSGKTEVVKYLMDRYGWPKVYFAEVVFDEMKKQGIKINEANERKMREGLREKYGQRALSTGVVEKIKQIDADVVIAESLYSWAEYLHLKEEFGGDLKVLAVHASPKQRYARLGGRAERGLTPEEAQSRDYSQIENLGQAGPIAMANFTVINDGDLDRLYQRLEEIDL